MQDQIFQELKIQSRSLMMGFPILVLSIFSGLWLLLEPLNLFGINEQWFKSLGMVGYLLLILLSISVGSIFSLIRHYILLQSTLQQVLSVKLPALIEQTTISERRTREITSELCAFVRKSNGEPLNLHQLLSSKENEFTINEKLHIIAIVSLFRDLGLLQIRQQNKILLESERALGLIRIIGISVKDSVPFLGNWKAIGNKNNESMRLNKLLQDVEQYRIDKQGGLPAAPATRSVNSALIIIKGRYKNTDRYLMQWSSAWGGDGYYWFLGGVMESTDKTIEECARRELQEELDIENSMILSLIPLTSTTDKRISSRIGLLTEYIYTLFAVTLDANQSAIQRLLQLDFELETHVTWVAHKRINRWLTWEEVANSEGILRNASVIIERLEKYGIDAIPLSITKQIEN